MMDRLIELLSPSEGVAARPAGYSRMFAASFLGVGLYWAWLFCTSLGSNFAPAYLDLTLEMPWYFSLLSFAGYIGMLVVVLLAGKKARDLVSSPRVVCAASVVAACCTALLAAAHAFCLSSLFPLVPVALALTGVCTGVFLAAWGMWFARHITYAAAQIACALVVAGIVFGLVAYLPSLLYVFVVTLLPLGFGAAYLVSHRCASDGEGKEGAASSAAAAAPAADAVEGRPNHVSLRETFPWHACLALSSIGLVVSLLFGLSPFILGSFGDVMPVYAACSLAVGVAIAAYTAFTHRNFGFSAAGAVIVPLASGGILLFAMFHELAYVPAVLLVRLAYVLLDALMWLQLSKVLEATGSIRSFLVSRLALSAGELLGAVLFGVMGLNNELAHTLFDALFVVCGILLMCVFSLAVVKGGIENAWGLVQPAAGRGQRLADAVEAAADNFKLTRREREVAVLMMRGKSGPYIQEKLCITANTFQTHTRNIYRKMDVHSRSEMEKVIDSFLS